MTELRIERLRRCVLSWGEVNVRRYPWRFVDNSYYILVSEFMLQRTQYTQVLPVYTTFIKHFPDIDSFYIADTSALFDILAPLGLTWRITGMVKALRLIRERFTSIPLDSNELLSIPNIGTYIASATICFSQNIAITLVDTNTVRVIGRCAGLSLVGEARRRKVIKQAIFDACDPIEPRLFYYSIIDIAHSVCSPKKPACIDCPLVNICEFFVSFY